MIEIQSSPLSPNEVIGRAKTAGSGCIVTYVGVIRNNSRGRLVKSVEYRDTDGKAVEKLASLAEEAKQKWQLENVAISHRVGSLNVGDINLVVAIASAHRSEGLAACQYVIDQFKSRLPTQKQELYR